MPKKIQVEFKPTTEQANLIRALIRMAVWIWNWGLSLKREADAAGDPKRGNGVVLAKRIKTDLPEEFRGMSSMVVQQALRDLETANYFGTHLHHSWVEEQIEDTFHARFVGEQLVVANGKLTLPRIGRVPFVGEIPEDIVRISQVRVWREDDRYFGEVTCRTADEAKGPSTYTPKIKNQKAVTPATENHDDGAASAEFLQAAAAKRREASARPKYSELVGVAERVLLPGLASGVQQRAAKGELQALRAIASAVLRFTDADAQFGKAAEQARRVMELAA